MAPRAYKLHVGIPAASASSRGPQVDLIIGLLSVPAAQPMRQRRRASWLSKALYTCPHFFEYRFILSIRESFDGSILNEAKQYEDLLFVDAPVGFDFISYKVKLFIDWAVDNFHFKYLLKADDDSTICLSSLCTELGVADAVRPLYMGKFKFRNTVNLDPSQRQYNPRYLNETGRTTYLPYAGGAGYAISFSLAEKLASKMITSTSALPFRHFPREDATFGLWMSGLTGSASRVESARRWLIAHPFPSAASNSRTERYHPKLVEDSQLTSVLPRHCLHLQCGECTSGHTPKPGRRANATKAGNPRFARSGVGRRTIDT
ncbi:hypothetical protein AB1Y20_009364 [Prymnesium parvum]|uniref:Hexosyltransferase n=1 Tax=Prymnesium parvum TaxID=97485 RepID=A0AB34K450_PRYPA